MEQTDEELYSAYNLGSDSAFQALFERHKDKMFNFSLRLLNNRADAEDVVSEVFIQLFHKRFQADGRAKLTTWLYTVARNTCISRIRSVQYTVSLWLTHKDGSTEAVDVADGKTPSPFQGASQKDMALVVNKALARLPLDQRQAVILREYESKDYAEIAEILGVSVDHVKVLIFRGRESLRKLLGDLMKEGGR